VSRHIHRYLAGAISTSAHRGQGGVSQVVSLQMYMLRTLELLGQVFLYQVLLCPPSILVKQPE
jgi:hypothetical protein